MNFIEKFYEQEVLCLGYRKQNIINLMLINRAREIPIGHYMYGSNSPWVKSLWIDLFSSPFYSGKFGNTPQYI